MSFPKKSLVVAVLAFAALGVAQAQAGVIYSVARTTVSGVNGTFDDLTFRITGWDGVDATYSGGINSLSTLQGTWTVSGSGSPTISVPGTTANWQGRTTNFSYLQGFPVTSPPASWVNFDNTVGVFGRGPDTPTPTTFGAIVGPTFDATWFTTEAGVGVPTKRLVPNGTVNGTTGVDQGLIAEIFVTPGANVGFTGVYNSAALVKAPLTMTSNVPEPVSLGLLCLGSFALLHRRRKAC